MKIFVRAITTGFALSLGAALFKKVSKHIGLDEKKPEDADKDKENEKDKSKDEDADADNPATDPVGADGATDPGLRVRYS